MSTLKQRGLKHTNSGETVTPGQKTVTPGQNVIRNTKNNVADAVKNIITEDEYKILCKKEQLTDEEFTSVIDYQLTQSLKPLNLNIKTISQKQVFELYRLHRRGMTSEHPTLEISLDNLKELENGIAWALWKFHEVSIKKATIETADQGAHFINVWRLTVWGIKQAAWDVIYKYNKKLIEFRIWEDVIVKRGEWISIENPKAAARHWIKITYAWQFYRDE